MKNIVASIAAIVFLIGAVNAHAVTREIQYNLEDQTNFGKVAASGSAQTGNPGYLSLVAPDAGGTNFTYYIWINGGGKACLASYPTISAYSSFPTGNWNRIDTSQSAPGMGCTVIGSQS